MPPTPDKHLADRIRAVLLHAGTTEHYEDAALYDHEYRRRRVDVNWYRALCRETAAAQGTPLRLLELGCGTGRLLLPLVRDGHTVVGVDRSRPMLRRCAERLGRLPRSRLGRGTLLQADFRELPLRAEERFPLIVCPFNAFMHLYTLPDVERCLSGVRAHLLPGGIFALDVLLPDLTWLARDPTRRWAKTRFRHPETGQRLIYSTSTTYDPARQLALTRIFYDPAEDSTPTPGAEAGGDSLGPTEPPEERPLRPGEKVVHLAHRQFFPQELLALLHYNGFAVTRHEGGFDGEPLGPASAEQVICARVR